MVASKVHYPCSPAMSKLSKFSKKGNWCCIQDFSPFVIVFVLVVFDKIVGPFKNAEKI